MRKRIALAAAAFVVGGTLVGCAESWEEAQEDADHHEYRAKEAAAEGDYQTAAAEQRAAQHARLEARNRWNEEHSCGHHCVQSPGYPYNQRTPPAPAPEGD